MGGLQANSYWLGRAYGAANMETATNYLSPEISSLLNWSFYLVLWSIKTIQNLSYVNLFNMYVLRSLRGWLIHSFTIAIASAEFCKLVWFVCRWFFCKVNWRYSFLYDNSRDTTEQVNKRRWHLKRRDAKEKYWNSRSNTELIEFQNGWHFENILQDSKKSKCWKYTQIEWDFPPTHPTLLWSFIQDLNSAFSIDHSSHRSSYCRLWGQYFSIIA